MRKMGREMGRVLKVHEIVLLQSERDKTGSQERDHTLHACIKSH